jgi:hypothetical protein
MGLLFLIAGAFIPAAYDRKGFGRFIRDRLFRLGVPTAIFMLVLHPLTLIIMALLKGDQITFGSAASEYGRLITSFQFLSESGPLWFALALLIFSIAYAVVRMAADRFRGTQSRENRPLRRAAKVTNGTVVAVIACIASGSFLVRLVQPFGTSVLNMQLCYFTQYILLFLIGLWAGRTDFLRGVPYHFGMSWFRISLAAGVPAWFILGALGGALSGSPEAFAGGWHWQAAGYAVWESFFSVGFCLGLIVLFRQRVNVRGSLTGFLSDNAFGVYVFHTPILVAITLACAHFAISPLSKAGIMAAFALAASYLFVSILRTVPGLRRLFS